MNCICLIRLGSGTAIWGCQLGPRADKRCSPLAETCNYACV